MIRLKNVSTSYQNPQSGIGMEFMSKPNSSISTSSDAVPPYYEQPIVDEEAMFNPCSVARPYLFWLDEAHHQLEKTRQEAEEAFKVDSEIDLVPESAYDDAFSFLEILFHLSVPIPDISWAEDGSLSFEWYPEEGIATMGIYGDNLVIYTVFFEEKRQLEGICELSDTLMLSNFLATLVNILCQ